MPPSAPSSLPHIRRPAHRLLFAAALAAAGAAAQAAGTLTVCTPGAPDGFDIAQYETLNTADATQGIYDQLLAFKPGTTEVAPGLAERWEVSPDGRTVTLFLRRGVKFHTTPWFKPTRDFNADDVVWSIGRVNDKAHPAHGAARNGYIYWAGMNMPRLIQSVAKVDDHTVKIGLTRPEAPFVANLAMSAIASVYSAEYGEQLVKSGQLEKLNTHPVGTGPFAFRAYQKDAVIRYVAHPQHWRGAPKVDHLVFAITVDPNVRAQRVRAGECLVGVNMKRDTLASLEADAKLSVVRSEPLAVSYLTPNVKHKFLEDKRLRQALRLAIDRKTFIASVYGGYAVAAGSYLPRAMWSHDAALQPAQDVEQAKALVKGSGYDGRELSLFLGLGGATDGKRIGELLQSDLGRIGLKVRVQLMESGELARRTGRGEHDLAVWSWYGDNGDPDNYFTNNLSCDAVKSGGNKSQWCDPAFEKLIDEARRASDPNRRTELYRQAQRVVHDEVPAVPLAYPSVITVLNKRVKGFVPNPLSIVDFRAVSVD
jgi:dipeptide transport system substrate-binding protein